MRWRMSPVSWAEARGGATAKAVARSRRESATLRDGEDLAIFWKEKVGGGG